METVLDAEWVMEHGVIDCLNTIKSVLKNHPAYVIFDIDCLDPSFAPGTGVKYLTVVIPAWWVIGNNAD